MGPAKKWFQTTCQKQNKVVLPAFHFSENMPTDKKLTHNYRWKFMPNNPSKKIEKITVILLVATNSDPASICPASAFLAMPGRHTGPSLCPASAPMGLLFHRKTEAKAAIQRRVKRVLWEDKKAGRQRFSSSLLQLKRLLSGGAIVSAIVNEKLSIWNWKSEVFCSAWMDLNSLQVLVRIIWERESGEIGLGEMFKYPKQVWICWARSFQVRDRSTLIIQRPKLLQCFFLHQ